MEWDGGLLEHLDLDVAIIGVVENAGDAVNSKEAVICTQSAVVPDE